MEIKSINPILSIPSSLTVVFTIKRQLLIHPNKMNLPKFLIALLFNGLGVCSMRLDLLLVFGQMLFVLLFISTTHLQPVSHLLYFIKPGMNTNLPWSTLNPLVAQPMYLFCSKKRSLTHKLINASLLAMKNKQKLINFETLLYIDRSFPRILSLMNIWTLLYLLLYNQISISSFYEVSIRATRAK